MPHVTIQYTANLDPEAKMDALCASLAEVICAQRDAAGGRLYPIGGTRVLAYLAKSFSKWLRTAAISASPVAFTRAGSRPGAMRTLR